MNALLSAGSLWLWISLLSLSEFSHSQAETVSASLILQWLLSFLHTRQFSWIGTSLLYEFFHQLGCILLVTFPILIREDCCYCDGTGLMGILQLGSYQSCYAFDDCLLYWTALQLFNCFSFCILLFYMISQPLHSYSVCLYCPSPCCS